MVTSDNPNREKLRISSVPGILLDACSIGKVTSLSISVAPNEGATVIIWHQWGVLLFHKRQTLSMQ
jgi:hypothetical protein